MPINPAPFAQNICNGFLHLFGVAKKTRPLPGKQDEETAK
jgi:hypothetical protein